MSEKRKDGMTRRQFIGQASCAGISSLSVLSTLFNLKMANQLAAADLTGTHPNPVSGTDYRTLVCIFQSGGNDSFNSLVPRGTTEYAEYSASRSNLAILNSVLHPLTLAPALPSPAIEDRRDYGLHPSMPELADMFNGTGAFSGKRRLSFVANVGTLIEPITKAQYLADSAQIPKALFSHSDQIQQWQTSMPQGQDQVSGWAGRAADVMHSNVNINQTSMQVATIPMNISLSGRSVFQTGRCSEQFVITSEGGLLFTRRQPVLPETGLLYEKNKALTNLMTQTYGNLIQQAFADTVQDSVEKQDEFQTHYTSPGSGIENAINSVTWPNTGFGAALRSAARTIAIRDQLDLRRQTIFVEFPGWDHHSELLNVHQTMLMDLSQGISAFQGAIEALGIQDDVLSFTASDFGRTIRSNGRGTDHAWGGNQMVFGGKVHGGDIFGTFPSLELDADDDVGLGGRILPSTSVDGLFAEMLKWFGISKQNLPYALPNVENFYDLNSIYDSNVPPLGFIG